VDVVHALTDYGIQVTIYDPWARPSEVNHEYQLETTTEIPQTTFDAIVLGVAHKEFSTLDLGVYRKSNSILFDVKGVLKEKADGRL
jgi:UDP-N-acetyl-D-galactosamine dehydrogenase